jgi:ABC-type uncharacterized transport system substrate-binding protein
MAKAKKRVAAHKRNLKRGKASAKPARKMAAKRATPKKAKSKVQRASTNAKKPAGKTAEAEIPVEATIIDVIEEPARPGGNTTGFTLLEYGSSGKWLELLKEIAPRLKRVAVLRDPALASGGGQLGALQAMAPSVGVEVSPVGVHDAGEIERAITAFARGSNGGLIVTGSALAVFHRELIIALAARHQLPAGLIWSTNIASQRAMSVSRARSRPIFPCRRRPNTNS